MQIFPYVLTFRIMFLAKNLSEMRGFFYCFSAFSQSHFFISISDRGSLYTSRRILEVQSNVFLKGLAFFRRLEESVLFGTSKDSWSRTDEFLMTL